MSAEQPYTDEAMKDALMTELALCLFNDLTVSETTGRVWAVITAAMAEKDAEIARLREALEGLIDDDPCWYDHHGYCQAHYVTSPCEMAIARQALKPESTDHD